MKETLENTATHINSDIRSLLVLVDDLKDGQDFDRLHAIEIILMHLLRLSSDLDALVRDSPNQ